MKTLTTLLALATLCATSYGQTIKTLGYNTTNGHVVYSGTNALTFTNTLIQVNGVVYSEALVLSGTNGIIFDEGEAAAATLSALGAAQTIFTVKTNDQTIINETNATTITDLTFATEPGARYVVTFVPIIEGATALSVAATNALVFGNWNTAGTGFAGSIPLTGEGTTGSAGITRSPLQVFYVEGDTNAGSISVTFRSTVATNTNTIKEGSFLRADKMP